VTLPPASRFSTGLEKPQSGKLTRDRLLRFLKQRQIPPDLDAETAQLGFIVVKIMCMILHLETGVAYSLQPP
jgi:hypothetical protein